MALSIAISDDCETKAGHQSDAPGQDQRSEPRLPLTCNGPTLRERGGSASPVTLLDLSTRGFQVEWLYPIDCGARVWLKLSGLESLEAVVVWAGRVTIGCKFERALHPAVLARIVSQSGVRQ
jgi:hypothetical protein